MEFHEEIVRLVAADGEPLDAWVTCREDAAGTRVLALLPPHPSLGGETENNVMQALTRTAAERGWVAVRLRYRGACSGEIGGRPALAAWDELDARGDYRVVADDCVRGIEASRRAFAPDATVCLLGYSFGVLPAWMVSAMMPVRGLVGISPPLSAHDFGRLAKAAMGRTRMTLIGGRSDPFCPFAELTSLAAQRGARVVPFEAEDHFYRGQEAELARVALGFLEAADGEEDERT